MNPRYYQPEPQSHREKLMQMMQGFDQSMSSDLQNAAMMQRMGQQEQLFPLQRQEAQLGLDRGASGLEDAALQRRLSQMKLDAFPEEQSLQQDLARSNIAQNVGQTMYYGGQSADPNQMMMIRQVLQRMGLVDEMPQAPQQMNPLQQSIQQSISK